MGLLQTSRSLLDLPTSGLLGLPPEILLGILGLIPVQAIISVSATCKQLNEASKDKVSGKDFVRKISPEKSRKTGGKFIKKNTSPRNSRTGRLGQTEGRGLQCFLTLIQLILM